MVAHGLFRQDELADDAPIVIASGVLFVSGMSDFYFPGAGCCWSAEGSEVGEGLGNLPRRPGCFPSAFPGVRVSGRVGTTRLVGPAGLAVVTVAGLCVRGFGSGLWRVGLTRLTVLDSCLSRGCWGGSQELGLWICAGRKGLTRRVRNLTRCG
jgi:hypothetical protein